MFARTCNKIKKINKNALRNGVDGMCVCVCLSVCLLSVHPSVCPIFIIEEEEEALKEALEFQILMFLISDQMIIIFLF